MSKGIEQQLMEIPLEIKKIKLQLIKQEEVISEAKKEIKVFELSELSRLNDVKDSDGKKLYSNETQRLNALNEIKATNESYVELEFQLKKKEKVNRTLEVELDYWQNLYTGLKAICYLNRMV